MIRFRKLDPDAELPTRGSAESAGLDLTAIRIEFPTGSPVVLAHTGLAVELPRGTYGQIAPRSGLARKHGIRVLGGVIDRDYTGEIVVMLGPSIVTMSKMRVGQRVAQLLVLPCLTMDAAWSDGEAPETGRGAGGFGSTGL